MKPFIFCLLFVAAVIASAATTEARPRLFGGCHGRTPLRTAIANRPHLLARTVTVIRERERRPLQRIVHGCHGRARCSG